MSENPTRLEVLAGELETLRSEIAVLDAVETPDEVQSARFAVALTEWDTKKADHDALVERAAKVEAVRAAAVAKPVNREHAAPERDRSHRPLRGCRERARSHQLQRFYPDGVGRGHRARHACVRGQPPWREVGPGRRSPRAHRDHPWCR